MITIEEIKDKWCTCTRCEIGQVADKHVLYEVITLGSHVLSPKRDFDPDTEQIDAMFVGEGPGVVENISGKPFSGPAGQLLRSSLQEVCIPGKWYTIVLTNLVACRPYSNKPWTTGNRQPTEEEISNCSERISELYEYFQPLTFVAVGELAARHLYDLGQKTDTLVLNSTHPSYILRMSADSYKDKYQEELDSILTKIDQFRSEKLVRNF